MRGSAFIGPESPTWLGTAGACTGARYTFSSTLHVLPFIGPPIAAMIRSASGDTSVKYGRCGTTLAGAGTGAYRMLPGGNVLFRSRVPTVREIVTVAPSWLTDSTLHSSLVLRSVGKILRRARWRSRTLFPTL